MKRQSQAEAKLFSDEEVRKRRKEKKKAEKESLNTLEFPTCKYYKIGNIYLSILNYHQKLF